LNENDFMHAEVRVFCPICKDGKNAIWHGSLIDWGIELSKSKVPDWAQYASRHEKAHNHRVMVQYPSGQIVPWLAPKKEDV
jgi:hypothetical protein